MKRKAIIISTIALLVLTVGISMAWFSDRESVGNEFNMGTVEVEVLEPGFEAPSDIQVGPEYDKKVQVKSTGSKKTYVRVKLIPEWSEPSLPVSNVKFNLAQNNDWVAGGDGYYYYKHVLNEGETTSLLLESVTFTSLGPEYEGQTLTIKAIAEGVQITHEAWKSVWGIDKLPWDSN